MKPKTETDKKGLAVLLLAKNEIHKKINNNTYTAEDISLLNEINSELGYPLINLDDCKELTFEEVK